MPIFKSPSALWNANKSIISVADPSFLFLQSIFSDVHADLGKSSWFLGMGSGQKGENTSSMPALSNIIQDLLGPFLIFFSITHISPHLFQHSLVEAGMAMAVLCILAMFCGLLINFVLVLLHEKLLPSEI